MQIDSSSTLKGCRWVAPPVRADCNGIETWAIARELGFEAPRLFWLTSIAKGQWRGRHAHRDSILATFAVKGHCQMSLDDGQDTQTVELIENGPGLIIGAWVWHELYDFTPSAAILVVASTTYSEADYIRDYDVFLAETAQRRKTG